MGKYDSTKKIRVLIAKVGLDGHDTGIKVLATALRQAGMEVIYLGLYQTPESVIKAAVEEDVDVIGLSFLSGGQLTYTPRIVGMMRENKLDDVLLLAGGVFPKEQIPLLKQMGVDEVFVGSSTSEAISYIHSNLGRKENTAK